MARPPLLARLRRQPQPPAEGQPVDPEAPAVEPGPAPAPERRPPYHPGALRRERKALVQAREERIRDLGGLMLEMYRHDRFAEPLLREQCAEVVSMEVRLQELDSMLATVRQQVQATRCQCGAPLLWGSHFCPNCGRPAGQAVVTCPNCTYALPADARFCGNCGAAAPVAAQAPLEPAAVPEATAPETPPEAEATPPETPPEPEAPSAAETGAAATDAPATDGDEAPPPRADSWEQ